MGFFPERNGNARKIISRFFEKDRADLTPFIPFYYFMIFFLMTKPL